MSKCLTWLHHYNDVTWTSCSLKSPVIRLWVEQLMRTHIKWTSKSALLGMTYIAFFQIHFYIIFPMMLKFALTNASCYCNVYINTLMKSISIMTLEKHINNDVRKNGNYAQYLVCYIYLNVAIMGKMRTLQFPDIFVLYLTIHNVLIRWGLDERVDIFRRHFQVRYVECKYLYFDPYFTEICSWLSGWQ